MVLVVCLPGTSWAAMGSMGSSSATSDATDSASSTSASTDQADLDELGLRVKLLRITGSSTPAADEASLPQESVGGLFPDVLSTTTTPVSIQTGIACHMDIMCGYDPCTCGKPDAWGHCACGGFEETFPTVTITSSDESVAEVTTLFGQTVIVPHAAGDATITVAANLIHYQDASYAFTVHVAPIGVLDIVLAAAFVIVALGIVAAIVFGIRRLVRFARRRHQERKRWRKRGEEIRREHPLTWKAKLKDEKRATGVTHQKRQRKPRPFLHDMVFSWRTSLPVLVTGLVVFLVLVPVSTTAVNDFSVFNVNYTHEQLKYQLYAQSLSLGINIAAVAFGFALSLSLFRFLQVKRATTAFLSIGISRVGLFASRAVVGMVDVLIAVFLPFLLSFALNVVALGLYDGQLYEFFYVALGYVLVALVAFALTSIATILAGTLFESCLFGAALIMGPSVIFWGVGTLAQLLLVGCSAGATMYGQSETVAPSLLDAFAWANPLLFFNAEGASHQYFMALHPVYYPELGNFTLIGAWFIVFVLLCVLAAMAMRWRRGEQAEMAGKSPVLSFIAVAVLGLAVFAAAMTLLGTVDLRIALATGAVLFILVSLAMLFGPLRGRTPRRVTLGCLGGELVCMATTVAVIATGGFGYAQYIPATSDVASVEVTYVGSPSYLTRGFSGVSKDASYYCTSTREYTDADSIELVRTAQNALISSAGEEWTTVYENFEASVVPYDVVMRYTMKDGSEVVRYYSQAEIGDLEILLDLDADENARALEAAAITGDTGTLSSEDKENLSKSPAYNAYRIGSIYIGDGMLNRIVQVKCTDEERQALLNAMADDLASLDTSELYHPTKAAYAALMFTLSPELDVSSFAYSFSNAVSYVTEDWTETMAWLRDHGYVDQLGATLDTRIIESITLQLDDPYASINAVTSPVSRYFMAYRSETAGAFWITQDYGALTTIDKADQIAQLAPCLRLGCFMDGGYLAQVKLRGIKAYVYCYLPASLAPDFV